LSLSSLREVFFLDEIHRLVPAIEEILDPAMEDYRIDLVIGQGAGARIHPFILNRFTLIGATTRAGLISSPLRARRRQTSISVRMPATGVRNSWAALAVKAGCDLNCGTQYYTLTRAIKKGLLTEQNIDQALRHIFGALTTFHLPVRYLIASILTRDAPSQTLGQSWVRVVSPWHHFWNHAMRIFPWVMCQRRPFLYVGFFWNSACSS
jgi:hypothetical protein